MPNRPKNEIKIRPADLTDHPTLLEFEQGIITAERPYDPMLKQGKISYYDLRELIHSPEAIVLLAAEGKNIIGSGYAQIRTAKPYLKHEKFAYLGFMYVRPEARGRGVIQLIINGLKEWTLQQGISEMRLEVYHNNEAAVRAYQKAGMVKDLLTMRIEIADRE